MEKILKLQLLLNKITVVKLSSKKRPTGDYLKEAKGKITTKKSGKGGYKSAWIYIPSKIYKDDLFPFRDNEEVIIEIEDDSLVISKNDDRSKILREFGMENATLPKLLEIKDVENKHQPFLYFKDDIYSYQEINRTSNKFAHGILKLIDDLELKKPKISLLMNNCPEFIFSWFGITKAGCVFVPIDKSFKDDILRHILDDSDTEILIIDYEFLTNFEKIENELPKIKKVLIRNAPPDFNFNDKYKTFQSIFTSNEVNPKINIYNDDPIELLYSSGVTGKPKGVLYRNVVLAGIAIGYELNKIGLNEISKVYCPLPLSSGVTHIFAVIPSLFYNKSIIITEDFDASAFWDEIKKYEPSCFCYFGGYLTDLLYQRAKINDRVHSIKFAYGFGAEIDLWNAFEERFGIFLYECWSHNEGIGITMNKIGSKGGKIGSIGKPLDFLELKIIDSEGNELTPGPNNIGEIIVRRKSGAVFEYYKKPENEDVEIGDKNWVYTGDFGYKDYDGYIYFKGKRTEVIQGGKDTIFTRDIERVANSHPDIVETAVIPISNGKNSKVDFKIVAVKVKNSSITHRELSDYLYHNLAYFHVPRFIEFKEELPKVHNTTFLKRVLVEEWDNGESKSTTWDTQASDFIK
jgi:crotonobetaine/carnitine-CoA ligase